jgi:hypothetical protein
MPAHRGGPARSIGEGPVMGLEWRGRAGSDRPEANPAGEEPEEGSKPTKRKSFRHRKRLVFEAWRRSGPIRGDSDH